MKYLLLALALAGAAAVATYVRYGSLEPCAWLERDTAQASGLPPLVAQARIRADFLLQGIVAPTPVDCLGAWWRVKAEDAAQP